MREWWSSRFVLPILTTSSGQAACSRASVMDGSASTGAGMSSALAPAGPGRRRSGSPARHRKQGEKAAGNAEHDTTAEYCQMYNRGDTRCEQADGRCKHHRRHRCEACNGRHPKIACPQGKGRKNKGGKGGGKGGKGGKDQVRLRSRSRR